MTETYVVVTMEKKRPHTFNVWSLTVLSVGIFCMPKDLSNPDNQELEPVKVTDTGKRTLVRDAEVNLANSDAYMSTLRGTWDEKEALLVGDPFDSGSNNAKSKISDPRLATIVLERSARVTYQLPQGEAMAVSDDDMGKNMLMNLLLTYHKRKANEQMSLLMKLRLTDLYSLVYGSMFGLVPWRVNKKKKYVGPEYNVLPIRDVFPQPGVPLEEADYCTVTTRHSIQWLKDQNDETWDQEAIARIAEYMKKKEDTGTADDNYGSVEKTSYVERMRFPHLTGSKTAPRLELAHEYHGDQWITWAPRIPGVDGATSEIIRVAKSPYLKNGLLPVVKKDCFPLLDSVIGLSEFERGKTLQYAMNSLINLYMDGVKYSIFPPLHINWNNAMLSTIKWGPGEKWLMKNPNRDVQAMQNINPQGINTFQSTYGFLLASLNSQAGTTDTSVNALADPSVGRTPLAIKTLKQRENTRDAWDAFMMDNFVESIMNRWVPLINEKMPAKQIMRLFGSEVESIEAKYPDVLELLQNKKNKDGRYRVDPIDVKNEAGYDYYHEASSTMKPQADIEAEEITSVIDMIKDPGVREMLAAEGKQVKVGNLMQQLLEKTSIKKPDEIIVAVSTGSDQQTVDGATVPNAGVPIDPAMAAGVPAPDPNMAQASAVDANQFSDPEIASFAAELQNVSDIPAAPAMV